MAVTKTRIACPDEASERAQDRTPAARQVAAVPIEAALQTVFDLVRRDSGAAWACALPVAGDRIGAACLVWPEQLFTNECRLDAVDTVEQPDRLLRTVLHQGRPFFVNRLRDGRLAGLPRDHPTLHAFALLPWRAGGQVRALLCIANATGGFCAPMLNRLQGLADLPVTTRIDHGDALPGGSVSRTPDVPESARATDTQHLADALQRVRELTHLVHRDALTGLVNRFRFLERLDEQLHSDKADRVALLFLDLDGFRTVNDSLGHDAGDTLLREVAGRLVAAVEDEEDVARLDGDRFTVIVRSAEPARAAHRLATELVDRLRMPYCIDDQPLYISSSVGIAVALADGDGSAPDVETLIKRADIALHSARKQGRLRIRMHSPDLERSRRRRSRLQTDLRRAVEQHEFQVHYQPQLLIAEQRLLGFEALLRWPAGIAAGFTTQETVDALEQARLIADVGDRVIAEACRSWTRWRQLGLIDESVTISVNVSVQQLGMVGFAERVAATLERESMPPERLIVEITESALLEGNDGDIIDVLKRLGTQISLDDFGTGYASLYSVGQLPLDHLKIDRSFIEELGVRPQSLAIVKSILALARSLGIAVIAEGVEDARVLPLLDREGCAAYQGFQFSRALAADGIERLLAGLDPVRLGHICNFIDLDDARKPLDA